MKRSEALEIIAKEWHGYDTPQGTFLEEDQDAHFEKMKGWYMDAADTILQMVEDLGMLAPLIKKYEHTKWGSHASSYRLITGIHKWEDE